MIKIINHVKGNTCYSIRSEVIKKMPHFFEGNAAALFIMITYYSLNFKSFFLGIVSNITQFFFNAKQLIVFGHAVAS